MINDQWTYKYMDVNYECTIGALHEDDVIKQDCHISICENGCSRESHWADITPYCVGRELVELYIRAGLPERQGRASWNLQSLNRHMQEQTREE